MALEVKDTIRILGFQNNEYNFLNILITSDDVIQQLTKYKRYRYRFVLESLLFSSNIQNNTDVIFVSCDGLNNTKEALINSKLIKVIGICYLNELKDWQLVKGQSKRSQAVFADSEEINTSHFAFAFLTRNVSDLLRFTITLLDGNGEKITFPKEEKKNL